MLQQNDLPEQEPPLEFDSGRGQCPNCACLTLQHRCPECGYLIRPPNSGAVVLHGSDVPPYDEGQQGLAVVGELEEPESNPAGPTQRRRKAEAVAGQVVGLLKQIFGPGTAPASSEEIQNGVPSDGPA